MLISKQAVWVTRLCLLRLPYKLHNRGKNKMTKSEAIELAQKFNNMPYYQDKPKGQRWRVIGADEYYIITTDDRFITFDTSSTPTKYDI